MIIKKRIVLILIICYTVGGIGLTAQKKPKFEQPILITSAGQSADAIVAGTIFKKLNLQARSAQAATAADIENIRTLVLVPGFSSKGLGAAGTSREQEMDRVNKLIAAAKEKKIKILMLHLGGKPRRGKMSDDFNKLAIEASIYAIVVKQGDEDGFFTKLAAEHKIQIDIIKRIAESMKLLEEAFR
jgi:cation diffusion facilitator CzcD-associated flavoprotein CzcO